MVSISTGVRSIEQTRHGTWVLRDCSSESKPEVPASIGLPVLLAFGGDAMRCVESDGVRWWLIMADCFCLFVRFCESVILWFRIWNCSLDKVHPRLANLLAEGTSEGPHANTSHPNQNAKVHVHQSFLAQRHGSWLFDIFCRHVWNGYLLSMCRVIDICYESVHKEISWN